MKVILVNGSPNRYGCVYTALCEVEKTLNEGGVQTEIFWIGNKPIPGCIACQKCGEKGECVFQNDAVSEFLSLAKEADGFVFGSPVYYASANGSMIAFMDRAFFSDLRGNNNKTFHLKPAAAVVSARRSGTTATFDQLNKFFTMNEMPVVSSGYWNAVHGFTPDDVAQDQEGLWTMRTLGRNMAFFLKCQKIAMQSGLALPEREDRPFTSFIR